MAAGTLTAAPPKKVPADLPTVRSLPTVSQQRPCPHGCVLIRHRLLILIVVLPSCCLWPGDGRLGNCSGTGHAGDRRMDILEKLARR